MNRRPCSYLAYSLFGAPNTENTDSLQTYKEHHFLKPYSDRVGFT